MKNYNSNFKIIIIFLAVIFSVLFFAKFSSAQSSIDNLQPGQWYEAPNSSLPGDGVIPSPTLPGTTGPTAIMTAWNGGTFDTTRNRLLVWGGGHGDYGGNEIYAFDINTFSWSRIWGPSSNIPAGGGSCNETYSDGNPASRHTYDGLVYLPTQDKFWSSGGSLWCGSGGGSSGTWMFNFATSAWERKANALGSQVTALSDYDPITGLIYTIIQSGQLSVYNPTTNTWASRGNLLGWGEFDPAVTMIYHPTARKLFLIGGGSVISFDMTQQQPSPQTLSTSGGSAVVSAQGPGLAYDPTIDKIVGWPGGGADIYSLDLNTRIWTKHIATNSVVPPTNSAARGTYGRFQYIPSKNIYIAVNSISNDVYFYKLSSSGGTPPPPDTQASTIPTNLTANAISSSQINLSWTASTDNVGVTGYRLERCQGASCTTFSQISTPTATSYNDTGLSANTTYRYQVRAIDAAGNWSGYSSISSATTQAQLGGGPLNIPIRTWTYYMLPISPTDGPIQQGHGSKHTRMIYNSASRQMVITGGDTNNQYISDNGSHLVWSKDLSTVNTTPNWTLIGPWCYNTGQIQPARPDTVGWAYDSLRNVGVMTPGFYFGTQSSYSNCQALQGKSPTETNSSVTFNFSNNTWSAATYSPPTNGYGGDTGSAFSAYDPVTDSVIRFRDQCCVEVLHRATNTWSYYNLPWYVDRSQLAIDVSGRNVYAIDTVTMHLLRFNVDTHTITDMGRLPASYVGPNRPTSVEFETFLVFDSINRVLIAADVDNTSDAFVRGLLFYSVDSGTWSSYEIPPVVSGYRVRGNMFGFDPANNVMIVMGGHGGTYGDPNVYWLYRYGTGTPDTTPPASPTGVQVQ